SDPHTGGDLSDMAVHGTKIPNDAGKMNLIPSVPRPDQVDPNPSGLGSATLAGAADNATDIPRRNKDVDLTDEIITGTGDQMPPAVESKRLHMGANEPFSKGHDRLHKHARQTESDLERYQGEGVEMDAVPGEE
ncbi:hypothetical protein EJ08DRAFT_553268, partial [Tothia fuscella]